MIKLASFTLAVAVAALASVPGCGKGSSCAAAVEHFGKIKGVTIPDDLAKIAIAKCEREPAAVRECVLAATSQADLAVCEAE